MTTIGDKVAHVLAAPNDGTHHCHWPGCTVRCKPAFWGCQKHWYMLPDALRRAIWRCYRPGQEVDKSPSGEYVKVARSVQAWIAKHHTPPQGTLL